MKGGGGSTPKSRAWKGATALAVVALLAAAGIPGAAAPPPTLPHGPITITSNAHFTAANGVVAGTGSNADPYVIAGWHFSTSIGTAVIIRDVTAAFVLRDNIIDGEYGMKISNVTASAKVENNQFLVRWSGLSVTNADVRIANNTFIRTGTGALGIGVSSSASVIANNSFVHMQIAISATASAPIIEGNDIHTAMQAGIQVASTMNARIRGNVITDTKIGVSYSNTFRTDVHSNLIVNGEIGIFSWVNKDTDIWNNTIEGEIDIGVQIETSTGNFTANVVIHGQGDGVQIWHSPMLMIGNHVENNLGVGLNFMMASADARANVLIRNGIGILVQDETVVKLHANVMVNNTIGISIPYVARQTIAAMSANFVNGFNVDGTVVASQKVYFYKEANVQILGQVRDSGFSAGYYGSITAQGNVVLYEVDNARIQASLISHANAGVTAVNSFNVVVESSVISDTKIGVNASVITVPFQVPPCAVSVKNSTINITVDPFGTLGVDVRGCLGLILNNTINTVDTGIRLNSQSWGNVSGNVVTSTLVGIDVGGLPGMLTVSGNTLTSNRIGAKFAGTVGDVTDNRFESNAVYGAYLSHGADLTFERNVVHRNGVGVGDAGMCSGYSWLSVCGSLRARNNTFTLNKAEGARINGTAQFNGDAFSGNGADGARLQGATLVNVTANGNAASGARVNGAFTVRGSTFLGNGAHGLAASGAGDLRDSTFAHNAEAGLSLSIASVNALRLNLSYNLDGIRLDDRAPSPTSLQTASILASATRPADTLDIHLSKIWRNQRDGIRAGIAPVNATHNWWGGAQPPISIADQIGAFQNGASPGVRFLPYYADATMTTTGPIPGI